MDSKIEKISRAALQKAQEGVSNLVGAEVLFALQSASLMKKDLFVEQLDGANIFTGLVLKGSYRGDGCLVFSRKSAIKLSGKMIMLPPAEMNTVVAESVFEEEMAAAFEEIPRVFITAFLEPFKSQEFWISSVLCKQNRGTKDRPSDAYFDYLVAEHTYYQVAAEITVDGLHAGVVSLLLPAFILVCCPLFAGIGDTPLEQAAVPHKGSAPHSEQLLPSPSPLIFAGAGEAVSPFAPLVTQRLAFLANELTTLIGASLSVKAEQYLAVDGIELTGTLEASPHISASFSLHGLPDLVIWMFAAPADALWLGALLSEGIHGAVLARLQAESFSADRQDGFSEIGAVIINSITAAVPADSETDPDVIRKDFFSYQYDSSELPEYRFGTEQACQLCSLKIAAGALGSARLYLLFPAAFLELLQPEFDSPGAAAETLENQILPKTDGDGAGKEELLYEDDQPWQGRVLIIDNEGLHAEAITKELDDCSIPSERVQALTQISRSRLESFSAIILVIDRLNEMALGLTIKINSLCSVPLIVAASQWRQSEVLKAVRYGVSDILMTPAQRGEVLEKLRGLDRPSG